MKRRFTLSTAAVPAVLALVAAFSSPLHLSAQELLKPGTLLTVAGTGEAGFQGEGGPATDAVLTGPGAVAIDALRNLFFTDGWHVAPSGLSWELDQQPAPNSRVLKVVGVAAPR